MAMSSPATADTDPMPTRRRSGTRCSAAFTVVSTICGRFAFSVSRASVAIRRATTATCGETRS
jgi:hypothetical protein